jgi:hypothetical protein
MLKMRTIYYVFCLLTVLHESAVAQTSCYAYLRNGNVYATCGKSQLRLTNTADLADFAISDDGAAIAVKREYVIGRTSDNSGTVGDCRVDLYSLSAISSALSIEHSCGDLYASCGTILLEDRMKGVLDAIAGKKLQIDGYRRFVCNADRSVVGGWPGYNDQNFSVGTTTIRRIEAVAGGASVSPSGTISYFTDGSNTNSVCQMDQTGKPLCLKKADAFGRISVSNSGEVLFTTHTGDGCFYRNGKVTKAQPPATGDDQCLGIAVWKPGSAKVVVEEIAKHPQWLTEKAANAVKACATTSQGCIRGSRP